MFCTFKGLYRSVKPAALLLELLDNLVNVHVGILTFGTLMFAFLHVETPLIFVHRTQWIRVSKTCASRVTIPLVVPREHSQSKSSFSSASQDRAVSERAGFGESGSPGHGSRRSVCNSLGR